MPMDVSPGVLSPGPNGDALYVSNDGIGAHAPDAGQIVCIAIG